jgi:uncharacterized membrane protein YccC
MMAGNEGDTARARSIGGMRQALLTAAAAWVSYATAAMLGLHEGYWAAISAIVVLQFDFSATWTSSRDRFIGTAIGALIAWGCAMCWHGYVWIYALAIIVCVFVCRLVSTAAAARLAAVTLTVIVLIPKEEAPWRIALYRCLEVSWGIAVAVALASSDDWLERHWRARRAR